MALLRLLGATSMRTTRIALTTTGAQALTGLLLGTAAAVITAPAWSAVSFQFTALRP